MYFRCALAACVAATLSVTPVQADSATTTTTAPPSTTAPATTMSGQYASLAASMLEFYATASGGSLDAFVASNPNQVASLLGSTSLLPTIGGVSSVFDVQRRLESAGATMNLPALRSMDELLASLTATAGSIDGRVTLSSASFATQLGALRVPALTMPSLDGSSLQVSAIPTESLAFGLFANASLANLVSNHPDVFAQVQQSGLGTPGALDAWRQSMMQAGTTLGSNLSRLPFPCLAEMLQGMATGASAGSSSPCTSCAIAGAYLHNQATGLLDPNRNTSSATQPMQPWLQDALTSANPGLAGQLNDMFTTTGPISACSASGSASTAALQSMLPGLFAGLSPTAPGSTTLPGGFGNLAPAGSTPTTLPGGFDALGTR